MRLHVILYIRAYARTEAWGGDDFARIWWNVLPYSCIHSFLLSPSALLTPTPAPAAPPARILLISTGLTTSQSALLISYRLTHPLLLVHRHVRPDSGCSAARPTTTNSFWYHNEQNSQALADWSSLMHAKLGYERDMCDST